MNKQRYVLITGLLLTLSSTLAFAVGEADGVLVWGQKAELSLPVSGVIAEVKAGVGDSLKAGDVMLVLDTRRAKANLKAANARVAQMKPSREEAQRELERAEELFDRTVLSQVEMDKAVIDHAEKDARYHEARANVEQARLDVEYSTLKAPFDLMVLDTHVVKGQTIVNQLQSNALFTVAGSDLQVRLMIKPAQMAGLNAGQAVNVSIGGKAYEGKVLVIDYDESRSLVNVTIDLPSGVKASAGQSVRVTWQ